MIITLVTEKKIYPLALPLKVSGKYWIQDQDDCGRYRRVAAVEGLQGTWYLRSSQRLALLDDYGHELTERPLKEEISVFQGNFRQDDTQIRMFTEPSTEDRCTYKKIGVQRECQLNIGRAESCDICYKNEYVSAKHACLIWRKGAWSITDTQSSNGTFVNNQQVVMQDLHFGDAVYIMGMRIVVGNGFFAINNPDGCVTIANPALYTLAPQQPSEEANEFVQEPESSGFFRSPRIYRAVPQKQLQVEAPPSMPDMRETPMALLIGPALTMGMTSIVMATVAAINYSLGKTDLLGTIPTMVMSLSMLCGTLLWPILTRKNEAKKKKIAEQERVQKYHEYLDDVRNQMYAWGNEQRAVLDENCPSGAECRRRIIQYDRHLWERSIGQADFLCLRLGLGTVPLEADIKFHTKGFAVQEDSLLKELDRLADEPKLVENAPVTCSLLKNKIIGIIGDPEATESYLKNLILQIAALHSCDEVKLVFLVDQAKLDTWKFGGLLPHTWSEDHRSRYFAALPEEARTLSMELERIMQERNGEGKSVHAADSSPYYVVIAQDQKMAQDTHLYERINACPEQTGFFCITAANRMMDLPKECSLVVQLGGTEAVAYNHNDAAGSEVQFNLEADAAQEMDAVAGVLANLAVGSESERLAMPNMLTFMEMYHVGKTEHLNALTRWKENSAINTLQAPIGVGKDGELVYLDLHERAHGPHGLIAGMTGSGKSEFIITFILSLALNYHPDEVSFILIDYKGGGLAGAFENDQVRLPHLAGTITNLDGAAINRALISIESELRRRQAVFNEARRISGEGTIDIYKYQQMYHSGLVKEPVPHLFIISDEFAELKAQQPEFMTQLISTARIGRSLGVHLILATQKPVGVVNDQIWSNSRFRVCLKVQEKADSMEMLKRPDAAALKDTGRFYLQVGYNELFLMGQSAWCGAPYTPSDYVEAKKDESIRVIDRLGRVQLEMKPKRDVRSSGESQLVSIVRYLSQLAAEEGISTRQLWLPPLPAVILLDQLKQKYRVMPEPWKIEPVIGEYDDPAHQSKGVVTIPFTSQGNTLVYGATGSGKTTMLNTMLVGLLRDYTAKQLNLYLVDMGEETLRVFADAPQVGDVLCSADEERIQRLFTFLQKEIVCRRKILAEYDGDYVNYCRRAAQPVPQILVVIRNYAAFAEQFELLDEALIRLTRDCCKYGIYFLLTSNATSSVRYRMAQNFGNVYALQLNDRSDYIGLFGSTGGVYPSRIKGRGIFKAGQVYEFQIASFAECADQTELRNLVKELKQTSRERAPRVPSLPEVVTAAAFEHDFDPTAVPVGITQKTLQEVCLNLDKNLMLPVLAMDAEDLAGPAYGICQQLRRLAGQIVVLDGSNMLLDSENTEGYFSSDFAAPLEKLFEEMVRRNHIVKGGQQETQREKFTNVYCLFTGLPAILSSLNDEQKDKLNAMLNKAEHTYAFRFVLCGSENEIRNLRSESWYQHTLSTTEGLWVGNGITDQHILKLAGMTPGLYRDQPQGFGYLVRRGKPILAKLITKKDAGEDNDT